MDDRSKSYFDELHGTMTAQNAKEGVNEVFYAKQFAYIEEILQPGMTIVDIGCGPFRRLPASAGEPPDRGRSLLRIDRRES